MVRRTVSRCDRSHRHCSTTSTQDVDFFLALWVLPLAAEAEADDDAPFAADDSGGADVSRSSATFASRHEGGAQPRDSDTFDSVSGLPTSRPLNRLNSKHFDTTVVLRSMSLRASAVYDDAAVGEPSLSSEPPAKTAGRQASRRRPSWSSNEWTRSCTPRGSDGISRI